MGSVAIWLEALAIHDVIWHSRRALALTMSWTEYDAEEISFHNPPNDISPLLEFYEWQDDNSRWYCKMCFLGATAGHLKNRKHCNKVWSEKEKQAARAEAGARAAQTLHYGQLALQQPWHQMPPPPPHGMPAASSARAATTAAPVAPKVPPPPPPGMPAASSTWATAASSASTAGGTLVEATLVEPLIEATLVIDKKMDTLIEAVEKLTAKVDDLTHRLARFEELTWLTRTGLNASPAAPMRADA